MVNRSPLAIVCRDKWKKNNKKKKRRATSVTVRQRNRNANNIIYAKNSCPNTERRTNEKKKSVFASKPNPIVK